MSDALVVIFKGISQYQSLNTMATELAEAYRDHGYHVDIIDLQDSSQHQYLSSIIKKSNIHVIINISGYGLDLKLSENLYQGCGIPVISLYFDPLILYANQIDLPISPRLITTTADTDIEYWGVHRPGGTSIRHLPHAVAPRPVRGGRRRSGFLVFAGTGNGHPDVMRAEWSRHGPVIVDRLNRILEIVLSDTALRPLSQLILEAIGDDVDLREPSILYPYFVTLDLYLRARQRWKLVCDLAEYPLLVIGEGWEPLAETLKDRPRARVTFSPARDVRALETVMARATLVLNACTPYHGSHERVFRAMALGTAALTSRTRWFAREAPTDALIQVDLERDHLGSVIDDVLTAPGKIEEIAEAGTRWFLDHHTWAHRVTCLEEWLACQGRRNQPEA